MITPLLNYSIHHVVWYQGESNCGDEKYGCSQMAMVKEWRRQWAPANTGACCQSVPLLPVRCCYCQSRCSQLLLLLVLLMLLWWRRWRGGGCCC